MKLRFAGTPSVAFVAGKFMKSAAQTVSGMQSPRVPSHCCRSAGALPSRSDETYSDVDVLEAAPGYTVGIDAIAHVHRAHSEGNRVVHVRHLHGLEAEREPLEGGGARRGIVEVGVVAALLQGPAFVGKKVLHTGSC